MSIMGDIFGVGGAIKGVSELIGRFKGDPNEKTKLQELVEQNAREVVKWEMDLEAKALEHETSVVDAQKSIIVAEMAQGDNFTKRARPTIVYAGLGFIFINHVFIPVFAFFSGGVIPNLALPTEFWVAWSSVVGIWSIGRSAERRGRTSKAVQIITGNKK